MDDQKEIARVVVRSRHDRNSAVNVQTKAIIAVNTPDTTANATPKHTHCNRLICVLISSILSILRGLIGSGAGGASTRFPAPRRLVVGWSKPLRAAIATVELRKK